MLGFLNIDKPSGMTSNAVVQKVKKKFKIKKIGHFGTLDPMASGVLPLAIGKATRLFDYSLEKKKSYTVVFEFGYLTDTLDSTGTILEEGGLIPTLDDINVIIPSMLGKQDQMPPMYSAKNVNGRRAYDLAREGIEFELKPKEITIHKLDLLEQVSDSKFRFNVVCSSGTYIRAIGRDLASKLGTIATMTELRRTMAGDFDLTNIISLDDCLALDSIDDALLEPTKVFSALDTIEITSDIYAKLKNGIKVEYAPIVKDSFVICDNKLVGIAKKNDKIIKLDTYLDD